jgi:parvulin-like peptidyl-prolyl isomerase
MRFRWILPVSILAAVAVSGLLASCGGKPGNVVAKIGDKAITTDDYNAAYLAISLPSRPKQMHTMEGKRKFLEDLINKEVLVVEATKMGLTEDPTVVRAMKSLTEQEVLKALRDEAVETGVHVEPAMLREFYEKQKQKYHLQLLVFNSREEAADVEKRARGGAPFSALAGRSILARAYPDADLGWRSYGDFDEPLNSTVFSLKAGETSDLLEMATGDLVLARVVAIEPNAGLPSFEEAKDGIVEQVKNVQRRTRFNEWTQANVEKYQVTVDPAVAGKLCGQLEWNPDPAAGDPRPQLPPDVEAEVIGSYSGGKMTVGDFIDELMLVPPQARPPRDATPSEFIRMVTLVLTNRALVEEGRARGLPERDDIRRNLERAQEERIVTMLFYNVIKDVSITDEDIRTYYDNYKDSLQKAEEYELSRIVLGSQPEAAAVLRQIRSGQPFEKLAEERSIDARTAKRGGKLSPATADVLPPEVREVVASLAVGGLGGPVKSEEGWVILRLDGHTPERQLTFDETKDTIQNQLLQTRQGDVFDAWIAEKRQELGVEVHDDVLEGIELVPVPQAGADSAAVGTGGA